MRLINIESVESRSFQNIVEKTNKTTVNQICNTKSMTVDLIS